MKEVKQSFKEIMFIELRDLRQDLELLIEDNRQRSQNTTISERVFQENIALFKNELIGLNEFTDILEETNPKDFANLDNLIQELSQKFRKKVRASDLAEAIIICVERKMQKVANYVLRCSKMV